MEQICTKTRAYLQAFVNTSIKIHLEANVYPTNLSDIHSICLLVVEARNARLHGGLDKDIEDPVATKIWKALNSVKEIKGIYDSSTAEYDEGEQLWGSIRRFIRWGFSFTSHSRINGFISSTPKTVYLTPKLEPNSII